MITTAKRQLVGAVAAGLLGVAMFGGVAEAQPPKAGTEPAKTSEKKAEPERKPIEKMDDLPKVKVQADDSAEVKAKKERLLTAEKKCMVLYVRSLGGQLTGTACVTKLGDSLRDLTTAAEELYSDPKDQLPWFEFRLAVTEEAPNFPSVEPEGRDESEKLSWKSEQEKAEQALEKVQKKLKK